MRFFGTCGFLVERGLDTGQAFRWTHGMQKACYLPEPGTGEIAPSIVPVDSKQGVISVCNNLPILKANGKAVIFANR